jgi:hypothetical protein
MPTIDGLLSWHQAGMAAFATGYSGKLNHAVHFDGVI